MSKNEKIAMIPRLRFAEFRDSGSVAFENGNVIFNPVSKKANGLNLPVLAITQEYGAIPRDKIDYNVSVSDKSLESYKVVKKGDFIISLRSFEGGIEYSLFHGICSPAYIILRKKIDIVEQYYKYYFKSNILIQDLNKNLEGIRDGKMVSYKQFSDILLPNPSHNEQEKIADCLSSLSSLITAENKKLSLLKDHKKGLMQKLFPAEGETVPELRFAEFRKCGEWEEKKLGEICIIYNGGTPDTSKSEYWGGDIDWLTPAEMNKKNEPFIDITDRRITEKGLRNCSSILLPVNTIILSCRAPIGHLSINTVKMAINQGCKGILSGNKIFHRFIYYYLLHWKNALIILGAGNTFKELSTKSLSNYMINFPSISEQQKISDCLSSLDALITAQSEKIDGLKLHKKGLMQGLFPSVKEVSE